MADLGVEVLQRTRERLANLRSRAAQAIERLSDDEVNWRPDEDSNSIANLVLHMSGNLKQRLHSEVGGEPFARNRDAEFSLNAWLTRNQALAELNQSFAGADAVLSRLTREDLARTGRLLTGEATCLELIVHTAMHLAEHVGQILYIGKQLKGPEWVMLTTPHKKI